MFTDHRRAAPEPDVRREPLDVRLALGAGAAWIAVLLLINRTVPIVIAVAVVAALVGGVLIAFGRRSRVVPAVALTLFCIALVLIPLAGRIAHADGSALHALAAARAATTLEVRVTDDPHTLAAKGPAGSPRVAVEADAVSVSRGGRRIPTGGRVLILGDAAPWSDVLPGQRMRLDATVQPDLDGGALSVTAFERGPPQRIGVPPWWQRAAGTVRSALRAAVAGLPDQVRGLLPGLVDGDTVNLDPVLAERFRLAGLTHLVAVSGTNCSLVIGAVLLVLRRLRVRPWLCAVAGLGVLVLFVLVARPSPSVLRAALMATIALFSLATGRPRAGLPALSAVTIALLLWDPTLAGGASFAMSVLATAALLVIAPGWARALRRRRLPLGIAESVAVAAAAHVVTAPVVAAISGRVSLVAIPANVLAEPVVGVTTILGFGAAVVAPLWLGGGAVLAWLAGWPCRWLVAVADFFGGLHGATVPWPGGAIGGLALLVALVVIMAVALRSGPRRVLVAGSLTAVAIFIPVRAVTSGWPPAGWVFVACDVGQGDALALNAGAGRAVVVDTGPDPVAVDRCLRDLGVHDIPLLVLSHMHLDHVGGLSGAVRGRRVGQLLAGPLGEPVSGLGLVTTVGRRLHRTLRTPAPGTHLDVGPVGLDVLGPARAYHGTRSDPNNSSLVLRATIGGTRILLPGDAEIEAQREILASGIDLRADVLKIPHHGSAYSDPAFLAAVHADVSVVSVGAHNDYGHPSPVLLDEMARLGVPLLRTDRDGDVAVVVRDGHVSTVRRGLADSVVGLGPPAVGRGSRTGPPAGRVVASVHGARMVPCPPVRSLSTTCPTRCPRCSCSSGTRICSSSAPLARSPPQPRGPPPKWRSPSGPGTRSRGPSCTNCSGRRCSATNAW